MSIRNRFVSRSAIPLLVGGLLMVLPAAARASGSAKVNNLSAKNSMGKVRIRPVFQNGSGATALQQGDVTDRATDPNRTIGDAWLPPAVDPGQTYPDNSPGLRLLLPNPFPGGPHTHYHAGDTKISLDNVSDIEIGDTLMLGSPSCDFATLSLTCKDSLGAGIQPAGQIVHVVGGDIGFTGAGILDLAQPLVDEPQCFTLLYGACAINDGVTVIKLPTLYQGQQFRVDIPHWDLLNGSPNDVTVTARVLFPADSHNASPALTQWRALAISHDSMSTAALVLKTCGPPAICGLGFTSFYVPREITRTATIGPTFSVDTPDTWYTLHVTAADSTGKIWADGVTRFKLNPVAIVGFDASPKQAFVGESVIVSGFLRDNTSLATLASRPVEDVLADIDVGRPSLLTNPPVGGMTNRYSANSCVNTLTNGGDRCAGAHGRVAITFGGFQGLGIKLPGVTGTTLNCDAGPFNPLSPPTYGNLADVPGCVTAPFLAATGTLIAGRYNVTGSLRGYSPAVSATTTFDVVPLF